MKLLARTRCGAGLKHTSQLTILAILALLPFGGDAAQPATVRIAGIVRLEPGTYTSVGNSCVGADRWEDVRAGAEVEIAVPGGPRLASVPLGAGSVDRSLSLIGQCAFQFAATVPAGRAPYRISLDGHGHADCKLATGNPADLRSGWAARLASDCDRPYVTARKG